MDKIIKLYGEISPIENLLAMHFGAMLDYDLE